MLDNNTLAISGEQLTQLNDDALAAVVGGTLGPGGKIFGEIVKLLWECVKEGLDDVISAAGDGYGDARAS